MTVPLDEIVRLAVAALASELRMPAEDIEVVDARAVTWRDGSIGCPRPGFFYTQALVAGARVVLATAGETYVFHQGGTAAPFHCLDPREPLDLEA